VADGTEHLGPVQLLVIAFEDGDFDGTILDQLRHLRDHDAIRLLDLLFVAKDEQGDVVELEQVDLSGGEAGALGALVRPLIGIGVDGESGAALAAAPGGNNGSLQSSEDVWFLADAVPLGTAAAVALIEHRWAIGLRDAIVSAGGHDLVDHWVHPDDLIAIGAGRGPS
jgi:uncharacterized membrane protein